MVTRDSNMKIRYISNMRDHINDTLIAMAIWLWNCVHAFFFIEFEFSVSVFLQVSCKIKCKSQ